jgi:glycine/D-amino acid oxidase-like deaminating enzyme/nitrite reductase/ring-hydroxylating ferredoxin subunit
MRPQFRDRHRGMSVATRAPLPTRSLPVTEIDARTASLHHSPWSVLDMPSCPSLDQDVTADVCVVGGGIAGLTTAYLLVRSGLSVVLLDDGPLAGGMSSMTTAHLSCAIDDRFVEIERLHGEAKSRLAAASHAAAIDQIEAIVQHEHIRCGFQRVPGFLFDPPGAVHDLLERELAAANRAGLVEVARVARVPWSTYDTGPALRFPDRAQIEPMEYLAGVALAVRRDGGRLFTHSHADHIEGGPTARVAVGPHSVHARSIVVATNVPVNNRVAIHTKQAAYMTYAIGARIPRGIVAPALYWDTADPYHFVRTHRMPEGSGFDDADLLIVGGEDHKTGQATDTGSRHERLLAWARERFPAVGEVQFTWAGQVMETIDGLAFIGRNPMDADNVFIATGDSGMGLTHGTIAAILLTDLIRGRENEWSALYDPSRKPLRAAGRFVRETLNMAAQYTDWLTGGDVTSVEQIAVDAGAVVRRGLRKVAAYRDPNGVVHEYSAVCPHLGGVVRWNPNEATFDCPCHGSRFDKLGRVLNGPANRDLTPVDED